MFLIAGLGNPGDKYKNTRHNIGFQVTGAFAEKFGIAGKHSGKFNAIIGNGEINGTEVLIVQPQTFMNLSGEAVQKVMSWYKLEAKDLFVIYDDIAIDFGRIRFRPNGSAGGHNGIKSIIQHCGGQNFARLKVGIGPNPGEHLWKSYVLQKFSKEEQEEMPKVIDICEEAIDFYLKNGINKSRDKYNGINILIKGAR